MESRSCCIRRCLSGEKGVVVIGDTVLPAPTAISVNDEIIWFLEYRKNRIGPYGRGRCCTEKNISIEWGSAQGIRACIDQASNDCRVLPFSFRDDGIDMTISSYRGTLSKKQLGWLGDGIFYYKSASVSVIQK